MITLTEKWPDPIFQYGNYAISEEDGRIIGTNIYDYQNLDIFTITTDFSRDVSDLLGPGRLVIEDGKGYIYTDSKTKAKLEAFEKGFLTLWSKIVMNDHVIVEGEIYSLSWSTNDKMWKEF